MRTLTAAHSGTLAADATAQLSHGPWTAADGSYTVWTVVADDAAEPLRHITP